MAYDPGYGGQQRPYNAPAPPRAAPRGPGYGAQQQYNDYQGDYARDGYNDAYGQGPGDQFQETAYRRAPPPRDPYGPGPGPGRGGGGRPGPYGSHSDPNVHYRQSPGQAPPSPRQPGFNGGGFSNQGRGGDYDYEHQMTDQMSGMNLNGQRPRGPSSRASSESQRSQGTYGQQPMNQGRGPAPRPYQGQDYAEPRRGPPGHPQGGGYGDYNDGFNQQQRMPPPRNEFGPPGRSMTMPVNDQRGRQQMPPPQRMDTMPYNAPAGRDMAPPQRPSTAAGNRPPPQRNYPPNPRAPPPDQYGGSYDNGPGYRHNSATSFDDAYSSYASNPQQGNGGYGPHSGQNRSSAPDFDAISERQVRGSFEETMRPGPEHQQSGPRQTPTLNHAKSQPNLRQPQAAVFEMAGEVPSVPPMPQIQPYQPGYEQNFNESSSHADAIPRGPSAPPGAMNGGRPGLPANPNVMRPGHGPQAGNPDALPSHPMPVRAGLMGNTPMVNPNEKPPPVRNYGGAMQPGLMQQAQQLPPQAQPQPQMQPSPPVQGRTPPPKQKEPPVTSQELEQLRMVIKNNPNDQESALRLARRLVEASEALIPNLPDPKARSRARDRYLVDAHKILKKLSNVQNIEAMFFMADSLGKGLFGAEPDSKEAFTLYQSAAKLGHAGAAYRTAVCCEIGHEDGGGTRKDPLKAIQWYKRAATLGDPPAMYKVGMILLKGLLGQPRNPREAIGWLKRAAERADADNPHALHELGLLYESAQPNDVIIRDEAYAFSLFQQAADLGYKFSQFRLACAYEYGLMGCPIDPRLSIMWYSRAATQEEHQSELALSGWYLTGSEGVLGQSDTEAYLWARKAAVAGLAKAEYAMGYFTEVGIGVAPNLEDAKRWYWRAAAQDFPKAQNTGVTKAGYRKIKFCGDRAASDGIRYFWVDSCCIDKSSSAELSEAIISMFKWYQQAKTCYVYLPDVSSDTSQIERPPSWKLAFRNSRWFTCGWTLQELIAPSQVEFFSAKGQLLGTKSSLGLTLHKITKVPIRPLQGEPLYKFNVDERMSWSRNRQTTRGEDKAYCLLGILGVCLVPMYGEGQGDAMRRLEEEVSKHSRTTACLRDLRCTDPRDDKLRIEQTKSGLLRNCYLWILSQPENHQWRDTTDDNLLWIKGDPGKGKTMLLCGIIDETERCPTELVSFFFCQATDARLNNAIAVLRGLIYLLVDMQPSLFSYIETKYNHAGKGLFEDVNAWVALSGILSNMLRDSNLPQTTLVIDALDECVMGLPFLLDLIAKASSSPRVKWVVSSRNWPHIEEVLDTTPRKVRLCLQLNATSISNAVHRYIEHKVDELATRKKYNDNVRRRVQQHLQASAQETFLWVALVCQELENVSPRHTLQEINQLPPGLHPLYQRMLDQAYQSRDAEVCQQIMAISCVVYRPVTLSELMTLVHFQKDFPEESKTCDILEEIIKLCGSFLTVREHVVYFIHQSARDFLLQQAADRILSGGVQRQHYTLYLRSTHVLGEALRRNIYGLGHPGTLIEEVTRPESDSLAAVHYSCLYWADHLRDSLANNNQASEEALRDRGTLAGFVRQKHLYWLEGLSLLKGVPQGMLSLAKLEGQLQTRNAATGLRRLVHDAIRFVRYFKEGIERSPLQVYESGLVFAPPKSEIRLLFEQERPQWVKGPAVEEIWNACRQTLQGHSSGVRSIVFAGDGTCLASASGDRTVRLWDAATGQCLQIFNTNLNYRLSFTSDGSRLQTDTETLAIEISHLPGHPPTHISVSITNLFDQGLGSVNTTAG
ncbi:Vegetative incompatibility protein [Paramyrothecium foliicola]|nr:Vegetative incompatibility protein [Paramyrothecium foliicola]